MFVSVATITGEAVKRVRRSDAKPASTVPSYGIFALGSAMRKTDLSALHAVTGLEEVDDIWTILKFVAYWRVRKGNITSITISNLVRDLRAFNNFSTGASFSSLSNQEVNASHHVMMTFAILGTNVDWSG